MALPMITATRCGSTFQSGQPASTRAARAAETAHFWVSSIWSPTLGGIGSRPGIGVVIEILIPPVLRDVGHAVPALGDVIPERRRVRRLGHDGADADDGDRLGTTRG